MLNAKNSIFALIYLLVVLFLTLPKVLLSLLVVNLLVYFIFGGKPKVLLSRVVIVAPLLIGVWIVNFNLAYIICLKTIISILVLATLTNDLDLSQINQLLIKLKVPKYLNEIIVIAIRFSFSFSLDAMKLKNALKLRGGFIKKKLLQSKILGPLIGNFFIRSVKRTEKIHQAMKLRGY